MWTEERERNDERKKKDRYIYIYIYIYTKHSKDRVAARNKPGWRPPSNVTQAAVHKERRREEITQKKKKYLIAAQKFCFSTHKIVSLIFCFCYSIIQCKYNSMFVILCKQNSVRTHENKCNISLGGASNFTRSLFLFAQTRKQFVNVSVRYEGTLCLST